MTVPSQIINSTIPSTMAPQNSPIPNHRQIWLQQADPEIRIHYIECLPTSGEPKGTILLIHGFPESSYQFRHVTVPLAEAGELSFPPNSVFPFSPCFCGRISFPPEYVF